MLQLAVVSDKLAFAPQISPENVAEVAKLGFEQIICNRPDNEESMQPTIDTIKAEAEKLGLDVIYAPVANSQFTIDVITAASSALSNGKKTLMYCRTGTRSSMIWSVIQAKAEQPLESVFAQLRPIGYDICNMQDAIKQIAEMS